MKLISVFTPCYNEEENVDELYQRVKAVFDGLPQYKYEHLFIDNASTAITYGYVDEDVNGDGIVDGGDMNLADNNSTAIIMVISP